jgi:hypothetical protein
MDENNIPLQNSTQQELQPAKLKKARTLHFNTINFYSSHIIVFL